MRTGSLTQAELFPELREHAVAADGELIWPELSWQALVRGGALRWCIPTEFGGDGLAAAELLASYESLAAACLTTCFILSQRDAACRRILGSGNEGLCRELLPPLAEGRTFTTVGLSQLTTSRQHGRPALAALWTGQSVILNGVMPWVTGGPRADYFITGAVLEDGRQVLTALPRDLPGVTVAAPLNLMALQGSLTGEVICENVGVDRRWLLAGPAERVMASGRSGPGGLETSALALGLTIAAVEYLETEARNRPELTTVAERLRQAFTILRTNLHESAEKGCTADAAAALRARANSIVLRATQTALTASKGAGFLLNHPAQRWARQALFFLVWSCPRPAADATIASLAPDSCDV
jgi:alkylation response protein AidB-like acyl-CoA dehydrogenase